MAGDWIKLELVTADKPEVYGIAAELGITPETTFGHLFRLWAWADTQSLDGRHVRTTLATLDVVARCPGLAAAMQKVGWLEGQDGALTFPNFERHNGKSAKRRAQKQKQKQVERSSVKDDKRRPKVATREEKRRSNPIVPFTSAFLTFWSAWPASPRKQSRPEAWRKWQELQLDAQVDEIVRHVQAMAKTEQWLERGGRFIPAPEVYLNQRRWDGAEPAPQSPPRQFVGAR